MHIVAYTIRVRVCVFKHVLCVEHEHYKSNFPEKKKKHTKKMLFYSIRSPLHIMNNEWLKNE